MPNKTILGKKDSSVAFLFPGQGAQSPGMGQELYNSSSVARSVFHEVDMALGRPLSKLLFAGSGDEIRETMNAQPAIMVVSLACHRAMEDELGFDTMPHPSYLAGHSLGEYTALAVSGVLDLKDTARLVEERGRLMQEACNQSPGTMAAILGLDQMTLEEICRETGTYVSNVNTVEQIVISGERISVARALDLALARGAQKVIPLRVGGAFHSVLMEPAREGLLEAVRSLTFRDAEVPIVANFTGVPLTRGKDIQKELIAQICGCVQWKQSVDYMINSGVSQFIEIGPGRALCGMVKRIDRSAHVTSISDMESITRLRMN